MWEEDFARLDPQAGQRITRAIRAKLTRNPATFGKPLSKSLRGYWRLRAGPYRIIYRMEQHRLLVIVVKVGIRRDAQVYAEAIPRLRKLGLI